MKRYILIEYDAKLMSDEGYGDEWLADEVGEIFDHADLNAGVRLFKSKRKLREALE